MECNYCGRPLAEASPHLVLTATAQNAGDTPDGDLRIHLRCWRRMAERPQSRKPVPLEENLLGVFQSELKTQCELIIGGALLIDVALPADDVIGVWFGLQGILISASNASKLLWGSRSEPVLEARRPLRESVGVEDSSPLSSRDIRNDFEHFDERIEEWFATSTLHNYVERAIGPPGIFVVDDAPITDVFGQFDPATLTVWFWERSVELRPLVDEAKRVLARLGSVSDQVVGLMV